MRRSVEIPALDEPGSQDYGSSLPRKRSWLFSLPPYIRDVDLTREIIVVSNPEKQPLDLTGHYIVDKGRAHRFDFDDGYVLPPLADVHIYCAPGKHHMEEDDGHERYLMWTNKDGRPRRKEVLNQTGDMVMLIDANDEEIAALEVTDGGAKRFCLPRLELLQTTYAGNVVAALQGCRLALLAMGACLLLCNGLQCLLYLELGAMLLDATARVSDSLRKPKSRARALAVLGDRVEAVGLLSALIVGNLALNGKHYGPNNVVRVNLAMYLLLADVLSHWAESLVETATLADRAAATPFLPRTEALAPYVGRQRRTAAVFVKRNFIAQVAVTTVTAGTQLLLLLLVAGLADQQEGQERGWALQAVLKLHTLLLARFPVAVPFATMALLLTCILYRFFHLWISFMDFLDLRI